MAPLLRGLLICALVVGCRAAGRDLLVIVRPDGDQQSRDADPALPPVQPDLAIDKPPLARTVKGYEPEGVHVTLWQLTDAGWTVLVSWQTGESRVAETSSPPDPHDPHAVPGVVRYGLAPGQLDQTVVGDKDLVYSYVYGPDAGGMTYQSPILHHVLLRDLPPGATVYYSVGCEEHGFSEELSLMVPGGVDQLPVRIGVIGDLGQTPNSSATLEHLTAHNPDIIWHVGDLSYADNHCSDDSGYCGLSTDQRRWDAWARLTQPLYSRVPVAHVAGNHETELQISNDYHTFASYNARYPLPQDPCTINTSPNWGASYLDIARGRMQRFVNEGSAALNSSFYSLDLPGAHLIALNTYVPYGRTSQQYQWFLGDIASVDRQTTPWLVVMFHASPLNTYTVHFKEVEEFMQIYEPFFYQHQVDLVFSGHTHAFERTLPVYNYTVDVCGPMYTCIGDGGNAEGLARTFVDHEPPPYCADPTLFEVPAYQPSPSGESLPTFQEGLLCPTKQPAWSSYRDPSFGHGILTIHNSTHAEFEWFRNQDGHASSADRVFLERPGLECSLLRPRRVYPAHALYA